MDERKNVALQAALIEALDGEGISGLARPNSLNGRATEQNRDKGRQTRRETRSPVSPPENTSNRNRSSTTSEPKSDEWSSIIEGMVSGSKITSNVDTHSPSSNWKLQQRLPGEADPEGFVLRPWHILMVTALMLFGSFLWNVFSSIAWNALNLVLT